MNCSASPHSLSLPVAFLHSGALILLIMCLLIPVICFFPNLQSEDNWGVSYHGGQRRVQAGLRLAVVCIAVLVAAAVIDEADLKVHATLQPADGGNYGLFSGTYLPPPPPPPPPWVIFEIKGVFSSLHAATQQRRRGTKESCSLHCRPKMWTETRN